MSYCVNCGVELDDSAKKCALCQTPVINPDKPIQNDIVTPFAEKLHIPKESKTRFMVLLASMIMLIPCLVCFLINILFVSTSFWSLYVCCSMALLWIIFVFPFFTKKFRAYIMWAFDTVAVALYVYFFFAMDSHSDGWYFKAALPIILINSLLILIFMLWAKSKDRHWILKTLIVVLDIGLSILTGGLILTYSLGIPKASTIGIIIFSCLVTVVMFLIYCYSSKTIRKWLTKKFFT